MKPTRAAVTDGGLGASAPRPGARGSSRAGEAWAFVEACLRERAEGRPLAVTVAAPVAPVARVLGALPDEEAFCFDPAGELASAALGVAARVELGADAARFDEARVFLAEVFAGLEQRFAPGALEVAPRVMVGLPFEPGGGADAPWSGLGSGALVLPRWTYWVGGDRAALTLTVAPEEPIEWSAHEASFARLFGALDADERRTELAAVVDVEHSGADEWAAHVAQIKATIGRGEASKVVAARRTRVRATRAIDPVGVFERIGPPPTGAARYFVRRGESAFVGCTPERLFVKRGRGLDTEALAGSISASDDDGEARLAASEKDLEEHARVVEHLVERLAPICESVEPALAPCIRRLPTVLHLRTPIAAELAPQVDALTVIEVLHPTPAVGGTPPERARRFIAEREPDRGWYASPLGFVDARGDAEIFVALRCVLLRGAEGHLWAGAGIVAASEAGAEWEETVLKMRPMLRALGVSDR